MPQIRAPETRIDWFRVLEDVGRMDFSLYDVAQFTTIPKSSLLGYKNSGSEPPHAVGEVLIQFWAEVMGLDPDAAPRVKRMPTAASFRGK